MKKTYKLFLIITIVFAAIFVVANTLNSQKGVTDNNHILEINRIKEDVRAYISKLNKVPDSVSELELFCGNDYKNIDELEFSYDINNLLSDEKYVIFSTDEGYFRIKYHENIAQKSDVLLLNIIISLCYFAVVLLVLYVTNTIIKPFNTFSELPYALAKGNLSVPVKENKYRYFGRFLWGMDLLREKLEEDKKKELELLKEKKLVLLSLSHDIKTPLSAIKLYSKALSKNLYEDEAKKNSIAHSINDKAEEIEKYISEIVTASNDDFLQLEVNNSEVYIKDVFDDIYAYYSEKLELLLIDFSIEKYDNCIVCADHDRMVEVIQNIVENALKYGDGRFIRISSQKEDGEFHIYISNSGCTLKRDEIVHIFDSFFRGSNSKKQQGSGLGLFICKKLVNLMEGEIFADMDDGIMTVQIILRIA